MHKSESNKYLGDIIHESGKIKENLTERCVKAVASFSVIRAILEDIPLGRYRVEIGLELRQAMFINTVLFNCETWHGLKEADLTDIKQIDNQLLRYICSAHAKTPVEFLFLETGAFSISQIISSRRLNYLWEVISRNDEELVKRVFIAQSEKPSPGDFVNLVATDFESIGEKLNINAVCAMKREEFKKHIKKRLKQSSLEELTKIQAGHIKVNSIVYSELATQKYLTSPLFSNTETQLLFALRSNCVRGIKANFSSHYKNNLSCALSCGNKTQIDDQQHLLQCIPILLKLSSSDLKTLNNVKITDIYGTVQQQKSAVSIISRLLEIRNIILESQ